MRGWLLLFACLCGTVQAETFEARVIAVLDGDTVLLLRDRQKIKLRLADIDAPEKAQAFGRQSRDSLRTLVHKQTVQVESRAVDKYARVIGTLRMDGLDVNREQVRRGMAWEYSYHHSDRELVALQREAKQARRGLWAQEHPQTPWQWRREHPSDGQGRR